MNKCPRCGYALARIGATLRCLYCSYGEDEINETQSANTIVLAKNKEIEERAHAALLSNIDGSLDYCKRREITAESIARWHLGYITDDCKSMPAMWQKRLLFPIRSNDDTATVAFGGRTFIKGDDRPRYLNSPNGGCYVKADSLYGYGNIPDQIDTIYLCEGYMDAITMDAFGFPAVASLGTALTKQQAGLIARKAKGVCIAFDADAPGEIATLNTIDILWKAGFCTGDISVMKPEHAKDVDEALKAGDCLNEMRLSQYLVNKNEIGKLLDAVMHRRVSNDS